MGGLLVVLFVLTQISGDQTPHTRHALICKCCFFNKTDVLLKTNKQPFTFSTAFYLEIYNLLMCNKIPCLHVCA